MSNINSILDEYQRTCPDIHLELLGKTDLADVAAETLLADDGPDIFVQTNSSIGRLADSQAIIPLDSYIDKEAYTRDYSGIAVAGVSYKGKIYGYPESTEVITMIYNQDLISADELPTNTDDLLARAAGWDKTDYYFVYNAKNDAYFSIPWWQAAGVTIIDDEGHTTFASNAGYTVGNFIYALHRIMPDQIDYNLADTMFKEGRAPIIVNGPWYIQELDEAGINYGLHVLPVFSPTGVPAMPFVDVKCLLMTPNAENRGVAKAAVNLMQYYTRAAAQVELAQANKMVPTNNTAAADPTVKALPVVATFGEQAALGKPMPSTPFMGAVWDPIAQGLECIWTGQRDIKTCVDHIQSLAEENIKSMK